MVVIPLSVPGTPGDLVPLQLFLRTRTVHEFNDSLSGQNDCAYDCSVLQV